jgi:hypothetical protein
VQDICEKNVGALLTSVDFDVVQLARMALGGQNPDRSVVVLLSTAIMMSENRARDAEETAAEAEERAAEAEERAAEAERKAAEAMKMAAVADGNCDGVFGRNAENTNAILILTEHVAALQRQLSAVECARAVLPTPSPAANNSDSSQIAALQAVNARLEARVQTLERQLDQNNQLIQGAMLNRSPGNDVQAIMGRMQVLTDQRRWAEMSVYERRDQQRQLALEEARQEVADERVAWANERLAQVSARQQDQADRADIRSQFHTACVHLVASAFGDITPQEVSLCLCLSHVLVILLTCGFDQLSDRISPLSGPRN